MHPQQIIDHYGAGSVSKAAERLGLSRQALYNWLDAGVVPQNWQSWFERDTDGKLRAIVRKPTELRNAT
jgi:hypothetical protein